MIMIAVLMLTAFHPGYCFPVIGAKQATAYASVERKNLDAEDSMEMLPQQNTAYEPYAHREV